MINLIGNKFGDLIVIDRVKSSLRESRWLCKCICGNTALIATSKLKRGQKYCRECFDKKRGKHRLSGTMEYKAWARIIQRCSISPKNPSKQYYTDRGITVCKEWRLFDNFIKDIGFAPTKKHTVDRIDNNKGYEPSNCKWATMKEQSRNKRSNKIIEFNGQKKCLVEWCELYGLEKRTLCGRLLKGWDIEKAITTPVLYTRKKIKTA